MSVEVAFSDARIVSMRFATLGFVLQSEPAFLCCGIRSTRELTINETPIITVIGKAFWDVGHAPKDQTNRRKRPPQYAVWEIHPVMKLAVQ